MTIEAQVCPKCGAVIHFSKDRDEAICAYCNAMVVRPAAGAAPLEKEIEAEKLVQETVARESRLGNFGRAATAKILSAQTTGIFRTTVEGRAVLMSFAVEVQPDGEAPFRAATKTLVGLVAVDKYQAGTILDVHYDPQDPAQVSVDGRHAAPESNPEEQKRQMDAQSQAATPQGGDASSVPTLAQMIQAQMQAAIRAAEAPASPWGSQLAPGSVRVPVQFDPVIDLGAPGAVYRRQGVKLFASGTKPKELVLYHDGLAFQKGGKEIYTWRWTEVAAILTDMKFVASAHSGSGFTTHEFTLLKDSGEKLILDDDLGLSEIEELIVPVKKAVYACLYPALSERYAARQPVTFGPLTVHALNGLTMSGKTYAWGEIIEVKVDNGRLALRMRNDRKHEARTSEIPNVELLCRLIGVQVRDPQLWAS